MDLRYAIKRSNRRKKLTITVERDRSVVVHAPSAASDEAIGQVVEAKRQWIYEKVRHGQKYRELPHPPGKELVSGESALYLGRSYRIELVKGDRGGVRFNQCFFVPASLADRKQPAIRDWYVSRARATLSPHSGLDKLSRAVYTTRRDAPEPDSQHPARARFPSAS